jgi:hypothetical protein
MIEIDEIKRDAMAAGFMSIIDKLSKKHAQNCINKILKSDTEEWKSLIQSEIFVAIADSHAQCEALANLYKQEMLKSI